MENRIYIASDTKVFRDAVKLFDLIIEMTPDFPRAYKYTIGGKMHDLTMQLMLGIQHAFMMKEQRQDHLKMFICDFEVLQVLVRKAGEKRWISTKKFAETSELMISIGKQITAWKNRPGNAGEGRNLGGQG